MEKITSIGLTSEAILILMHVVIFSTDGIAEKGLSLDVLWSLDIRYFDSDLRKMPTKKLCMYVIVFYTFVEMFIILFIFST